MTQDFLFSTYLRNNNVKKIKRVEYSALSFSYIFVPAAALVLEMMQTNVSATIHIYHYIIIYMQ